MPVFVIVSTKVFEYNGMIYGQGLLKKIRDHFMLLRKKVKPQYLTVIYFTNTLK